MHEREIRFSRRFLEDKRSTQDRYKVEVRPDVVIFCCGSLPAVRVPRGDIIAAGPSKSWPRADLDGRLSPRGLSLVLSREGVVEVLLNRRRRTPIGLTPLRRIWVSLEDPEGLLRMLGKAPLPSDSNRYRAQLVLGLAAVVSFAGVLSATGHWSTPYYVLAFVAVAAEAIVSGILWARSRRSDRPRG
jgi:hypothetical protein